MQFKPEHFAGIKTRKDLIRIAKENNVSIHKTLDKLRYETQLRELQTELVNLQKWIAENNMRVVVLFEGRDAAGKGGAIRRITEHINPRYFRVVALNVPTADEKNSGFFNGTSIIYQSRAKWYSLTEAGTIEQWWSQSINFVPKKSITFLCLRLMTLKGCWFNRTPTSSSFIFPFLKRNKQSALMKLNQTH